MGIVLSRVDTVLRGTVGLIVSAVVGYKPETWFDPFRMAIRGFAGRCG